MDISPIAHIETDFPTKFGVPRQSGLVPELKARIVFEPPYRDVNALRGLDGFDYIWIIWHFSANKSSPLPPPKEGYNHFRMKYSIIVPVYNRPDEVEELLESLTRQTMKDFEVIIVEDGSAIPCKDVCGKYADKLDIHYYAKTNSGPGQSRNYGAERASAAPSAARRRTLVLRVITYILLTFWGIMVLFPFYWMILSSIKSYASYMGERIPKFIATDPTFDNYVNAFTQVPLAKYFLNTLIFTVITTLVMMLVIVFAAYAFARLDFRGKSLVFVGFLALMMIPNELVIITNFVTITNMNLRNTFLGLILPSVTSVFYIYLLKENFEQVPDELYYAAKVDGTSDLKYLFKVMIPICRPTIITVIILKVIECWNSYVWPRLITDDANYFLVSNGIQEIRENGFGRENIPAMMAAVVAVSLPLIVLFIIFRNKIMEGVSREGIKG